MKKAVNQPNFRSRFFHSLLRFPIYENYFFNCRKALYPATAPPKIARIAEMIAPKPRLVFTSAITIDPFNSYPFVTKKNKTPATTNNKAPKALATKEIFLLAFR